MSEENLEDVILPEKRAEWDQLRSKDCTDNFTADATDNFSTALAVMSTRNMIRENQVSSKKSLDVQKCCVSVPKHIVVMIKRLKSTPVKDSIKEYWKSVAMADQCQSIATGWRNLLMYYSTNTEFRTIQHNVATYEQTKKRLSYFYPKKIVEDGKHKKSLPL